MCYSLCKELKIHGCLLSILVDTFNMKSNYLIWYSWPGFNPLSTTTKKEDEGSKKGKRTRAKGQRDRKEKQEKGNRQVRVWSCTISFSLICTFAAPDNRCLQRDIEVSILIVPFNSEGISLDHLPIETLQARPAFLAKGSLGSSNSWGPSGPPLSGPTFSRSLLRTRCFWIHLRHSQKAQTQLPTTLVEKIEFNIILKKFSNLQTRSRL